MGSTLREVVAQNMAICKKKFFYIILSFVLICSVITPGFSELSFKHLDDKKVSYLDFFLLKFENTLVKRSLILRKQLLALRVQC